MIHDGMELLLTFSFNCRVNNQPNKSQQTNNKTNRWTNVNGHDSKNGENALF
jgi:hypothetical protein